MFNSLRRYSGNPVYNNTHIGLSQDTIFLLSNLKKPLLPPQHIEQTAMAAFMYGNLTLPFNKHNICILHIHSP